MSGRRFTVGSLFYRIARRTEGHFIKTAAVAWDLRDDRDNRDETLRFGNTDRAGSRLPPLGRYFHQEAPRKLPHTGSKEISSYFRPAFDLILSINRGTYSRIRCGVSAGSSLFALSMATLSAGRGPSVSSELRARMAVATPKTRGSE